MKITEERIKEYVQSQPKDYVQIVEHSIDNHFFGMGASKDRLNYDTANIITKLRYEPYRWKPTPEFLHFLITKEIDDAVSS